MRKRRAEMKKTKIEIIPMIDTMFFLLVFFILSSVGVIKMQGIDINLPKADAAAAPQQQQKQESLEDVVVVIGAKGEVFVNARPSTDGDIRGLIQEELRKQIAKKRMNMTLEQALDKTTLIISADPRAPYDYMVRAMDQARSIGVNNFGIAALQPDQGG